MISLWNCHIVARGHNADQNSCKPDISFRKQRTSLFVRWDCTNSYRSEIFGFYGSLSGKMASIEWVPTRSSPCRYMTLDRIHRNRRFSPLEDPKCEMKYLFVLPNREKIGVVGVNRGLCRVLLTDQAENEKWKPVFFREEPNSLLLRRLSID